MYDIAIIGAGVVGGMIARELSLYKLKICLLEKENDVSMGATKANSAIVHAGFDAKEGSLKAKLNVEGANMMEKVARDLGVEYIKNGSLVVGFNEEDEKTISELYARGIKNGVKDLAILSREEILALEPNIGTEVTCALHAPSGAIISPYDLAVAAIGCAMDNGVELFCSFEVERIEKAGECYKISSQNSEVCAKYVINCAGLFSDKIAKTVGDVSFNVHPRRGEYLLLDNSCGNIISHTVFVTPSKMGKGILVSPTVHGNLLIGPTAIDGEDKEDKSTREEFFASIFDIASRSVASIPRNQTITSFCGLRAVGSSGDFIISSPRENFINAAGIESPGLSASPAIAKYVLNMLRDSGLVLEKDENAKETRAPMHEFRHASREKKNEMIKKNPLYGKIICRCEKVTEGEIIDAIKRAPGARDIDGIKRRTRAGMGRCQGGFCSPYVIEILSRELGLSYEEITKSGGGSYVVTGKTKGARK